MISSGINFPLHLLLVEFYNYETSLASAGQRGATTACVWRYAVRHTFKHALLERARYRIWLIYTHVRQTRTGYAVIAWRVVQMLIFSY